MDPITGVHDLYLVFNGSGTRALMNIDNFTFSYDESLVTSNHEYEELSISVYPNPVTDYLYIEGLGSTVEEVSLFDFNGRLIETVTEGTDIDLTDLSSGVYFLQIYTGQKAFVRKIFKE